MIAVRNSLLATLAAAIVGCGGSSVTITPDFNHPELHSQKLKRDHVRFVKVTDGRQLHVPQIGTVHVGAFNKGVPYILEGDLANTVKTMLDTLVVTGEQDRYLPVSVSVDMFEVGENIKVFSEEGYFACNMKFGYPVTQDSMGHRVIFTKETCGGMDATNGIEDLIYKGVANCARSFVEGTIDMKDGLLEVSQDSAAAIAARDAIRVEAAKASRSQKPVETTVVRSSKVKSDEIDIHYCKGDKVVTGIRGSYCMLSRREESQFVWGLGISLTYFDINNKQDGYTGTFVNFGGRLRAKQYFSDAPTTAFIGGSLGLAGGSERISYGSKDEQTFFFGPNIEEVLGISLGRAVSFEVGSFQLAHFGSKLLPSDIGFIVGMSIAL